ncbi:MAG: NADH-quinone oxidoreductase subunit M [Caldilineales bacterium]|nr:NADH-quinone oxidoreductase subunit M [Caldilineales bacterium]MDW8318241.1 NADH-quinone oxidoreductase subunit M [Anaerolineae bacterium]
MSTSLTSLPVLSLVVFLPLVGALALLFIRSSAERALKWTAMLTALLTFAVSLILFFGWRVGEAGYQFVEQRPWVPDVGIGYHLGVDGISLFLVLLTTFLMPLTLLFSWDTVKDRLKAYLVLMLLLETAMLGVFVALDLVLFFVFFEASLIPMYFLVGRWGGPRRVYAALKFFIFTATGSALMLAAILVLGYLHQQQTGRWSFDLLDLYSVVIPTGLAPWLFLAFTLAFAIKVPLFPFHTWLPDAHVEAPTAGSVILAGILLKMGTYGLLRFSATLFPAETYRFTPLLMALAVVGILYGGLVALVQKDVKSLVAYSSVAHLGFVVLGLFSLTAQGVSGAVLQMVNHGLSTGALFLLVGFIYERRHTRLLSEFGGLWKVMPVYAAIFLIVTLSSAGLPGLNGFVGEFTILVGAMQASRFFAVLGTLGIIVAAWYLLWAFRQVFQGPVTNPANQSLKDLHWREVLTVAPIVVLFFVIGLFPGLFLERINPSVEALLSQVNQRALAVQAEPQPQALSLVKLVQRN